jgi:putative ABC transport system permease protein
VAFLYGNKAFPEILPEMIMVKLKPENTSESLAVLEKKFSDIFPGNVFSTSFLDNQISGIYQDEKLSRNQLTFFTCLAIGIACLGVLGMITNKVVEKKREIAIRKAMGAGMQNIGSLLLSNTVKQILIAILVATPAAYYFSQQYLERFTDRIAMQWWHFAFPVTLLLFIMFTTVAYVVSQAVRTNPVDSLRQD